MEFTRVTIVTKEILKTAKRNRLAGCSNDLFILDAKPRIPARDGPRGAFYETHKRGEVYCGFHGAPVREVIEVFSGLKAGGIVCPPDHTATNCDQPPQVRNGVPR